MIEQVIVEPATRLETSAEHRSDSRWLALAVALIAAYAAWRFPFWLASTNRDQTEWFLPWLTHILQVGRFDALEASYANYNPPFVYALVGSSFFAKYFAPLTVIKITNLPFILFAATLVLLTCRRLGASWLRALTGAALVVVAPETMENAWSWGQCDIVYSSFLLAFVLALYFRRPTLGMVAFALAFSLKLQAVFLGPLVLMLLITGEIPVWTLLLIPLIYGVTLVPAVLAGRPPLSLLQIYGTQYNYFNDLAYSVANPYRLVSHYVLLHGWTDRVKHIGLLVCAVCNATFLVYLWRRRGVLRSLTGLALLACLTLMLEVFTLPKMHERYYFPANLMLLLLVTINPRRFWLPALLLQSASVYTYGVYLYDAPSYTSHFILPVVAVVAVFSFLFREVERLNADSPSR